MRSVLSERIVVVARFLFFTRQVVKIRAGNAYIGPAFDKIHRDPFKGQGQGKGGIGS